MDDFEDDELYDDDYYNQVEEDDDDESLKDKYDRAKEYKEKFDKYKDKYNDYKNNRANNPASNVGKNAGKDVAKQSGQEAAKQGGKELGKEAGKKAGEEIAKEAGKKATTEAGKKVAKEGAKVAAKEGAKVAAEGAAASTGVGIIVAAAIEVADRLNKVKKKIEKKVDSKIEETTGVKDASKKRKYIPILLIFAIIMLIFIVPAMAMFAVNDTATSELTTLVRAREENNDKKLIMFTKAEIKELLNKDKKVSAEIAQKLAEEGYTLENDNGEYKSISYKNILKGYGNDLTNIFAPIDLTGATDGMEDVLDEETTYDSLSDEDKDVAVSMKNVKKYLMAEIDNFNEGVTWKETNLDVEYLNLGNEKFSSYSDYLNNSKKVTSNGSGNLTSKTITDKNYTVKDDDNKDTLLKMPKLSEHGINVSLDGGENKAARKFVDMLEPYMQKWIIPYTIYIDTQDEDFVDSVMKYMYHPADVSIFQLQKLIKTTTFQYYMKCHSYREKLTVSIDLSELEGKNLREIAQNFINVSGTVVPGSYTYGLNTNDNPIGRKYVNSYLDGSSLVIITEVTELDTPYEIATDSAGNPLVKEIKINRKTDKADSVAEVSHIESFYEISNREYKILPINENTEPDSSTPTELDVNTSNGIGTLDVVDVWNETVQMVNSQTDKYKVSYYTDEQMENLGRDISRIEWYQDVMGGSYGSINVSGAFGNGTNKFEQAYNGAYKETLERIWDGLVSWGYTEEQAAAVIGNIAQESSFNVTSVNSIGATGLCQWLGGRRSMLYSFASHQGTTWSDLTTQLQFLCMEISWDDRYSYASYQWGGHGQDLAVFKSGTVEEAAVGFRKGFERCGESEARDDVRISCARAAYETFSGREIEYPIEKIAASSTSTGSTGSGSSSGAGLGTGKTLYSYDDMYFAYYQIEQWYAKSQGTLITNTIQRVSLPEGGFSWPVETSGNEGAKKVISLYGVNNSDGITISTGSVHSYDDDEGLYKGANVIATHSGIVKKVISVSNASTYAYVEIETEDGKYKTHYGNLSEITVTEGQTVSKGAVIGKIGNTGSSATGSNIYLTYKMYYNGSKTDPLQYYYIKDSSGTRVDNYSDVDKTTISSGEYIFDGSRQYLAGSSEAIDGDINQGIEYYFTSSSGRTFNCYVQDWGPWASMAYGSRTIKAQGCSITSIATIATGYGYSVTPASFSGGIIGIFSKLKSYVPTSHSYNYDGTRIDSAQKTRVGYASATVKQKIANHLSSGKEVVIHVVGPSKGGASPYASSEHWMAILDIREAGGDYEVFVADPWSTRSPRGWRTLDSMLVSLSDYILVAEDE